MQRSDLEDQGAAVRLGPIPTPLRQRIGDLRGGPLAAVAFLAAAFALWWLLALRAPTRTYVALVRGESIVLRTVDDRIVTQVFVALDEHVEAGAPVCAFDARRVSAAVATARADVEALRAEVDARRAELELDAQRLQVERVSVADRVSFEHAVEEHRLEIAVEEHRLAVLAANAQIAEIEVERRRYEVRRTFLAGLVGDGLTPASEFAEIGARLDALVEQRTQLGELSASAQLCAEAASERLRQWRVQPTPPGGELPVPTNALLEPLRRQIDAQLARVAELEVEAEDLLLRAPAAGRVERLRLHAGLTTVAGEELAALVADGPRRADLYVPEFSPERLVVGERLELFDPLAPRIVLEGEVLATGPRVVELPQRLWRDPARPEHGFVHLVALPASSALAADVRLAARRAP